MGLTVLISIVLVLLYSTLQCTQACSQPMDWKPKPLAERLPPALSVIYGQFKTITKEPYAGGSMTDIKIETNVHCILKNGASHDIPKVITIWDVEPSYRCVNNMVYVEEGLTAIMMLSIEDGKWVFQSVNVQGAVHNATENNIKSVNKVFGAMDMKQPLNGAQEDCNKCLAMFTALKPGKCTSAASSYPSITIHMLLMCVLAGIWMKMF